MIIAAVCAAVIRLSVSLSMLASLVILPVCEPISCTNRRSDLPRKYAIGMISLKKTVSYKCSLFMIGRSTAQRLYKLLATFEFSQARMWNVFDFRYSIGEHLYWPVLRFLNLITPNQQSEGFSLSVCL